MPVSIDDVIIFASDRVYEQLGYGLSESAYRTALAAELRTIPSIDLVQEEYTVPFIYVTSNNLPIQVTTLRVDILIKHDGESSLIELKTVSKTIQADSKEYLQMNRYAHLLQATNKYIINFSKNGKQMLT